MSAAGTWHPGTSPLHRAPAGAKLLGLVVASVALFVAPAPAGPVAALALAAGLYALARIPPRVAWAQLRPVVPLVLVLAPLQWWLLGPAAAVVTCARLLALVALAALLTLTTRTEAILAMVERTLAPLARFGVDPRRVGLLVALTLRSVAVVAALAEAVGEARRARGVPAWRHPMTWLVPLTVRALRHADALGEALAARGMDD